jgi:hypothetical protein
MTREEIIRMAREAGLSHFYDSEGHCTGITDEKLVDEDKERNDDRLVEILAPFAALVAAAEREACAVIAEIPISGEQDDITMQAKDRVAAAIRARGQA